MSAMKNLRQTFPGGGALALATITSLVLIGCDRTVEIPEPEIRPVRTMVVEERALGETVSLTGTVQAQTEINFAFRIDGRLIERNADVGDTVAPGQLLARLNPDNEESSLQSARAQLAAARGNLVEVRNNYERQKSLVERQLTSRAAFDQAVASLQVAESAVTSAQASVSLAENRLSYTRLVADAGGIVVAVGAESGEVVGAGRMVVQIAREDGRDAVFDVPAAVKDAAPQNPEITVTLTSDPNVTAEGRVREVSPQADAVTGTFRVRVGLIEPPAALRLGSTIVGRMIGDSTPTISLPGSALVRQGDQSAVWIVDPETTTVALRNIIIESHSAARVVVEGGLVPGDVVVTAGVQALHPGQQVRLLGESAP
jgi:RND family efflux transporter MFP subunit